MATVHEIAECMQTVLKDEAERLGRETGFVQRKSKMMGAEFAQTLVFGWMSNPDATLGELCQAGAAVDVDVSCQGLDQRFSQSAATFLKALLDRAVEEMVVSDPVAIPLLSAAKHMTPLRAFSAKLLTPLRGKQLTPLEGVSAK